MVIGSNFMTFALGFVFSIVYHIILYFDIVSLSANSELRNKFLHPKEWYMKLWPLVKIILVYACHCLVAYLYYQALAGVSVVALILAEIVLFVPFTTLMSTIFIKNLGRVTCAISIACQLFVFFILKVGGVL